MTAELPDAFDVLVGDDVRTLPAMSLGAKGVISVLSNLAPGPVVSLVDAIRNGEWQLARELHYRLLPLYKGLFMETNPIPIKAAMNFCNLAAGPCRLPLSPMSDAHTDALHRLLVDSGYAPVGSRV